MAGFHPPQGYVPAGTLQLLPLRFEAMSGDQYLVSNMVGDFLRLSRVELERLASAIVALFDHLVGMGQ